MPCSMGGAGSRGTGRLSMGEWHSSMEKGGCACRCEGGRVVRVSMKEAGGCQRLVEHLRMEQKTVAFPHCPYSRHS